MTLLAFLLKSMFQIFCRTETDSCAKLPKGSPNHITRGISPKVSISEVVADLSRLVALSFCENVLGKAKNPFNAFCCGRIWFLFNSWRRGCVEVSLWSGVTGRILPTVVILYSRPHVFSAVFFIKESRISWMCERPISRQKTQDPSKCEAEALA